MATVPLISIGNVSNAFSSLKPPRLTNFSGSSTSMLHLIAGFTGHLIVHANLAGHDQALGFFATLRELIVEHRLVQAFAG